MNSLSWMIYAADVVGTVDWFFNLCLFLSAGGGFIWIAFGFHGGCWEPRDWKVWRDTGFKFLLPAAVAGLLVSSVVPSEETVYAIAASEMGEKALNSETGGKAVKALRAWLDRQIAGEKSDGDK